MMMSRSLFHGGAPGRAAGEVIVPGHERRHVEGCPDCAAHTEGRIGPSGDPLTPEGWVYASSDRQYGRYYASLYGLGWLYRVELRGDVEPSDEDEFPTWRATEAVVVSVLEKAVRLSMRERKRLFMRWGGNESEWHEMLRAVVAEHA